MIHQNDGRRLWGLQYLRAAAALAVVAYHAFDRVGLRFGAGAAGVDVFFVISGVVMWAATAARPVGPVVFATDRIIRIVPLYWLATLGMASAAWLVPAMLPRLHPTVPDLAMSLLFVPYRADDGQIAPLLTPGWTLNYEMFFYALFAGALSLGARRRLPVLLGVLAMLAMIGIAVQPSAPAAIVYTNPILLEFACGLLLGRAWQTRMLPGAAMGAALIVAGLTAYGVIAASGVNVAPARVLLWGVPALAIVGGTLALEHAGHVPRLPAGLALGNASYSTYLLHPVVIASVTRLLPAGPVVTVPICMALASLAGLASFVMVERPLGGLMKHRLALRELPRTVGALP